MYRTLNREEIFVIGGYSHLRLPAPRTNRIKAPHFFGPDPLCKVADVPEPKIIGPHHGIAPTSSAC